MRAAGVCLNAMFKFTSYRYSYSYRHVYIKGTGILTVLCASQSKPCVLLLRMDVYLGHNGRQVTSGKDSYTLRNQKVAFRKKYEFPQVIFNI